MPVPASPRSIPRRSPSPATRSIGGTGRRPCSMLIPKTRTGLILASESRGSSRTRAGCTRGHVPRAALDHAPVRGLRLRRRHEPRGSSTCSRTPKGTKANTGLSTAFDLPTLMGRDSDDPALCRRGRPVRRGDRHDRGHAPALRRHPDRRGDRQPDHQRAGGGDLGDVPGDGPAARHSTGRKLGGTLQNDILKEFHSQNEFIYPPEASVKLVVDTIEFASRSTCRGGTACRSAATTSARRDRPRRRSWPSRCATAWSTSRRACERGLDIDAFAPRLSFFFNSHNEFFEEICKLRAARRIWAARDARPLRRQERALVVDAHARADRRLLADRAAAAEQHRPRRLPGDGRRARRLPDRCTPTRWTRPSACRPRRRSASPCARSRSSPTRPACTAPSIRWAAPGSSRR